ncbi:MAG: DUF58 domain-containing protein [Acidimicrobiales bacterium]
MWIALTAAVFTLLYPGLFPWGVVVSLVGAAAFALLAGRGASLPAPPGRRHLLFTSRGTVALLLGLVAWQTRSSDSGLGVFLCAALAAAAAADLAAAVMVTRRVTVTADPVRTEAVAGDPAGVALSMKGPPFPVTLKLSAGPPHAVEPEASDSIDIVAPRGVLQAVPVEVACTGICGLIGYVRQFPLVLARPLYVGPRPVPPARPFPELIGRVGEGGQLPALIGDVVRGVRDYVPGDRRSQVHWRASARLGKLVVKEVEETVAPLLELVLDLGIGDAKGEAAAGRAAWYVGEAQRRGLDVVLTTMEPGGRTTAPVRSTGDAIRRLASAVAGAPDSEVPAWVTVGGTTTTVATGTGAVPPGRPSSTALVVNWTGRRVLRVGPPGDTWE